MFHYLTDNNLPAAYIDASCMRFNCSLFVVVYFFPSSSKAMTVFYTLRPKIENLSNG